MNKKRFGCIFFISLSISLMMLVQGAKAPFDFDQFLQELEKELGKIEQEEKAKTTSQPKAPIKSMQEKEEKYIERNILPRPEALKKDPESLFVDPLLEQVVNKTTKKQYIEPTQETLRAFDVIMGSFVTHLRSIAQKISAGKQFSPTFRENFALWYGNIIDTITVAYEQINSKKAYKKLFFAPPETNKQLVTDMKKLRHMILESDKKIKKIDQDLEISFEEELEEQTENILRKLAQETL